MRASSKTCSPSGPPATARARVPSCRTPRRCDPWSAARSTPPSCSNASPEPRPVAPAVALGMALLFRAQSPRADHGDEATMTVQGDLSTIHLADLLQNIQVHGRNGTLSLSGDEGSAKIFFREGNIALLAADSRAPLVQMLASSGLV